MFIDWLKSFRGRNSRARRPGSRLLSSPIPLEPRTLLSATPLGGEIRANSFISGSQNDSAVATDANGNYVVTLQSFGQDGDGNGIYAQRYNSAIPPPPGRTP